MKISTILLWSAEICMQTLAFVKATRYNDLIFLHIS
uniref:Uncharacterized protein n=1 Tax=Arundo donax TaxID=35708 RepID=A0A0A9A5V4_ARUDO